MIIMPCEPGNIKNPDKEFYSQYSVARDLGHKVYLFDHDELVNSGHFISSIKYPVANQKLNALLRNWILDKDQYTSIYNRLKKGNISLVNTPGQYLNGQYAPYYYNSIKSWSAKTVSFKEISDENILKNREFFKSSVDGITFYTPDLIIKDYVKSEKGNYDIFILKGDLSNEEFLKRVYKFIEARGKLFAEGIVFKEFIKLKDYNGVTNEWRIYISRGSVISATNNSKLASPNEKFISWPVIDHIRKKIDSKLFTIDVAEVELTGKYKESPMTVIEIGDGQVSGICDEREGMEKFYSSVYI